jgi:alkylated DNA nucleotide flippase Atl1
MAKITDVHVEQVRALVASIPPGSVATYGDIACAAGLSSPRIVAWIMRTDSEDLPWHRVITASGRPAPAVIGGDLPRSAAYVRPGADGALAEVVAYRFRSGQRHPALGGDHAFGAQ